MASVSAVHTDPGTVPSVSSTSLGGSTQPPSSQQQSVAAAPFVPFVNASSPPEPNSPTAAGAARGEGDSAAESAEPVPEPLRKKTYANLFVQGLHPTVTDAVLGQWFAPFGAVRSSKVMLNVRTGVSRGFGFVLFEDEDVGRRACDAMQGKVMLTPASALPKKNPDDVDSSKNGEDEEPPAESTLQIEPSQHDGDRAAAESNVMYLRNIPADVPEREAVRLCAAHGKLVSFAMAPIFPRHAAARRKQRQQQQQQQLQTE
uniref:RRM domain-containing protein n=1 Tax=Neobodo designis TaxID=312471 RepID=A0A7S1PXE9_NEODS|mmetsp:Transcript_22431/g.69578  ORF Transcript_22431/g.69578 Transcript_22431/m.69578 type:complete len:259 (+) Transcript_22431:451-1227(+)